MQGQRIKNALMTVTGHVKKRVQNYNRQDLIFSIEALLLHAKHEGSPYGLPHEYHFISTIFVVSMYISPSSYLSMTSHSLRTLTAICLTTRFRSSRGASSPRETDVR